MTKTEKIETADVPLVLNIVSTGVASRNSLSGRNPPRQREFSLLSTKHGLFRCVTYDAECIPLTSLRDLRSLPLRPDQRVFCPDGGSLKYQARPPDGKAVSPLNGNPDEVIGACLTSCNDSIFVN